MARPFDVAELLLGAELDDEAIERLRTADRGEIRRLLARYLPEREAEAVLARIDALIRKDERSR